MSGWYLLNHICPDGLTSAWKCAVQGTNSWTDLLLCTLPGLSQAQKRAVQGTKSWLDFLMCTLPGFSQAQKRAVQGTNSWTDLLMFTLPGFTQAQKCAVQGTNSWTDLLMFILPGFSQAQKGAVQGTKSWTDLLMFALPGFSQAQKLQLQAGTTTKSPTPELTCAYSSPTSHQHSDIQTLFPQMLRQLQPYLLCYLHHRGGWKDTRPNQDWDQRSFKSNFNSSTSCSNF